MIRRLAQLYRLLSLRARLGFGAIALLIVIERLVLAAGAFGLAGRLAVTWAASAGVVVLWVLRGFVRQNVTRETREKLTMIIASAALERGGDGSFLPGEEADAAVFEGRNAAEQVIVRHAPPLLAEPIAALVLLYVVKPDGVPVYAAAAAVVIAAILVAALRDVTVTRQRGAWRMYMDVARDTLTSIRAAPELIASGHEEQYLARLRTEVHDWTETAARAERSAALFQRIPFAAVVVVGVVLIVQMQSLELGHLIRLAVFFPPLAGLMRTVYELVRIAPRIQTLGAALDGQEQAECGAPHKPSPELPCEIRFESVSFSYDGMPVLKDVSFVWKPGEVLGIKGPNGSGKSTLLKLILGLMQPTEGRILAGGLDLREIDLPAWRKAIAYLPQRPYVPDKGTVIEVMRLTVPDLTEGEARRALEKTRVWEQLERVPRLKNESTSAMQPLQTPMALLSVGTRQRVLLARTFARPAPHFLLDEPDANLDAEIRQPLESLLRNPPNQMAGIVTHDEHLVVETDVLIELRCLNT